jgi:hypothetical protein
VPDPLDAVREAERLVREATERAEAIAAAASDPPPRGFDVPGGADERPAFPDLTALAGLLEVARGALPPELARQLAQALRELLIAIRAVLDYSIERLGQAEEPPPRVEDIPIE